MNKTAWFAIDNGGNLLPLGVEHIAEQAGWNLRAKHTRRPSSSECSYVSVPLNIDALYRLKAQIIDAPNNLDNEALSS